ncbi:hypothetical protein JTB14_007708 [Gonioctena quinquepunctata]|nr:hypothetical protein JTB14_007708 [Gonioctena quinquepunctata]
MRTARWSTRFPEAWLSMMRPHYNELFGMGRVTPWIQFWSASVPPGESATGEATDEGLVTLFPVPVVVDNFFFYFLSNNGFENVSMFTHTFIVKYCPFCYNLANVLKVISRKILCYLC